MKDSFGRTIDYLRLSITDRCNLRCIYCMPPEGVDWMAHNEILRFEEIVRLCRILAGLGIRAVKVTGGEPLVRRGAAELVKNIKTLPGIEKVTMTSNGVLLGEYLDALIAAGLDALNISLDSLDEGSFSGVTRSERQALNSIRYAIERASGLGLAVKVNCVPLRGVNEGELIKLAEMARNSVQAVRFIELMPLGAASSLRPLPAGEVKALLEKEFGPMNQVTGKFGNGPAAYYALPGFAGRIGFISALSHRFCASCNRLRLTAAGLLKPCLASDMSLDLRFFLRGGKSDAEIANAITEFVMRKPERHAFGEATDGGAEHRQKEMFRIGG
jgi:cyclic pyranopterin phosphate synthase